MISPHLLKVVESFSTSQPDYQIAKIAKMIPSMVGWEDKPIFVIETKNKNPKWCHTVLAKGPALNDTDQGTELVIIWWSEFEPDTKRVLDAIDWEKHAKGF
jgi:hypothetical protein